MNDDREPVTVFVARECEDCGGRVFVFSTEAKRDAQRWGRCVTMSQAEMDEAR